MPPYRAVCFDFDYTLGDSTDSIVAGFQYAFPILGFPSPDRETVRGTIGYLLEDAYTGSGPCSWRRPRSASAPRPSSSPAHRSCCGG